jgi:LEA14-like dessication related protein
MRTLRPRTLVLPVLALGALTLAGACPGAQVKSQSGEVGVVLRRIDVVEAGYDKMKLNVIVAIENGTNDDVSASADASIAVVGEATGNDEGTGDDKDGEAKEGEPAEGGDTSALDEPAAPAGGDTPIDGKRHAGSGAGKAAALNTSELPIAIEMPLPSDPALLEKVLDWKKMLVHVDGNVKIGLKTYPINGHREVAPPHLPDVKLKEAQVASVDGGTAGTGFFTVVLDNKNPFPVTIDKLSYTIRIKDKELKPSTGVTEAEHDDIPASAVGEYSAEVQIDEAAFGKELKALLKNPTVPYVIDGTLEVRGIQRTFHFTGDMKFAR